MDWLDYREKLGVGFCDERKFIYFKNKIFNYLSIALNDVHSGCLDYDEYLSFCNMTGTEMDLRLSEDYSSSKRLQHCLNVLDRHSSLLKEFLPYYIALTNTVKTEKYGNWKRIDFVQLLKKMLTESHIPYEILEENGQFFVFPKGVPELDAALVSATLDWLSAYPKTQSAWIKALKEYANQNDDNASDIADKFRKTLETFFREFFAVEKSLIHCKSMYGEYLKQRGVPSQIAGNFETVLQKYDIFMNEYAKHQDKTSINVLEYLMYQTGNIIRLLITLKQGEATPAD